MAGWFNVIKGAYPSLQQLDKTLPVAGTGIVRGSLIYVNNNGRFALADVAQANDESAYIYISLNDQTGLTEGMAGGIGQGTGNVANYPLNPGNITAAAAVVTGIGVGQPFEFETDQFTGNPAVGALLTVGANGKLVEWTEGKNVVGQVTKAAATRWANSATAVAGFRTGANVSVLTVRSLWIPLFRKT